MTTITAACPRSKYPKGIIVSTQNSEASSIDLVNGAFQPASAQDASEQVTIKSRLVKALEACLAGMNRVPMIIE
jgi:hypothetical protein